MISLSTPDAAASTPAFPATGMGPLLREQRGAVLVEFAMVISPLLAFFFCSYQYALCATASLVVRHAAIDGARAAAVTRSEQNPEGDPDQAVEAAVRQALRPWVPDPEKGNATPALFPASGGQFSAVMPQGNSFDDQTKFSPVRVEVDALYKCTVPLAARIVCTGPDGMLRINKVHTSVDYGAFYK